MGRRKHKAKDTRTAHEVVESGEAWTAQDEQDWWEDHFPGEPYPGPDWFGEEEDTVDNAAGFRGSSAGAGADDKGKHLGMSLLPGFPKGSVTSYPASSMGYGKVEPKCYHWPFDTGGIQIVPGLVVHGASGHEAQESAHEVDYVLDLANNFGRKKDNPLSGIGWDEEQLKALSEYTLKQPPILKIDWPDRSIPGLRPEFWRAILAILPKGTQEQPIQVMVCCIGGHGRTGTAIASLLLAGGSLKSAVEAIAFTRKHHCKKAIESQTQEKYLKLLAQEFQAIKAA